MGQQYNCWCRQMGNQHSTIKGEIVEPAIIGKRAIDVAQANRQSSHHQRGNHRTGNRLQSPAIKAAIKVVPSKGQLSNRQWPANGQSPANGQLMKRKQLKRQMGNRCTIKGQSSNRQSSSIVSNGSGNRSCTIKGAIVKPAIVGKRAAT